MYMSDGQPENPAARATSVSGWILCEILAVDYQLSKIKPFG